MRPSACPRSSDGLLARLTEARSRLVRGPVFKTGGGSLKGVSAGSIPVRFRQFLVVVSGSCALTLSFGAQMVPIEPGSPLRRAQEVLLLR